jgi:hypothetical protein
MDTTSGYTARVHVKLERARAAEKAGLLRIQRTWSEEEFSVEVHATNQYEAFTQLASALGVGLDDFAVLPHGSGVWPSRVP